MANKAFHLFDDLEKIVTLEQYKYDAVKNAYTIKGRNPARESDDYHAREVLYKFDRIKSEKKEYSSFTPLAGSLFYSVCENNQNPTAWKEVWIFCLR